MVVDRRIRQSVQRCANLTPDVIELTPLTRVERHHDLVQAIVQFMFAICGDVFLSKTSDVYQ